MAMRIVITAAVLMAMVLGGVIGRLSAHPHSPCGDLADFLHDQDEMERALQQRDFDLRRSEVGRE